MEKHKFKHKPTIIGNSIIIRPFDNQDIESMIRILNEPELKKLTGSVTNDLAANTEMDDRERQRVIEWYKTRNNQTDRIDCAIVLKETNQVIGELVFNEFDELTEQVNFRVLISQKYSNKGYGSETIKLFIQYGMENLHLHKISLEVFSFNPRAEHVYSKLGFKLEGIKREDFKYNDEYIDTRLYGLLRDDYEEINK